MSISILLLLLLLHARIATTTSTSLLVLSMVDGTTMAFDKTTGSDIFTYNSNRPTIRSWAAPGIPAYVPSLDGLLYRLNRSTGEAHVVHGNYTGVVDPLRNDAVVEILREESVRLVHLHSGRDVPITVDSYMDVPSLGKNIIAISQVSISASVVDLATKTVLANASLVHHIPHATGAGRCVVVRQDTLCAQISDSRDMLSVRNSETWKLLWSHDLPSPVVSTYGLGGVRIDGVPCGRRNSQVCGGDVFVAREGKSLFAMTAAANSSSTCKPDFENGRKRRFTKYRVANVADTKALQNIRRPFSFPGAYNIDPTSAENNDIISGIRRLFFLALKTTGQFLVFHVGGSIARKGWSRIENGFRT